MFCLDVTTYLFYVLYRPLEVAYHFCYTAEPKVVKQLTKGSTLQLPTNETDQPSSPVNEDGIDPTSQKILGPPDDSLFSPVYFPPPR